MEARLKLLAAEFGLESVDALIRRLAEYASPALRKQMLVGGAGRRARNTPELWEQILAETQGGTTATATAENFDVSRPSVQNIKQAAGLVKPRKDRSWLR